MRALLVSKPQPLLLVKSSRFEMHETTLVVPDLPLDSLRYARCLVDAGPKFEEHAVALSERALNAPERAIVVRALSAARPTVVSILWSSEEGQSPILHSTEMQTGSAAAATFLSLDAADLSEGATRRVQLSLEGKASDSFVVTRMGRFFSVQPSS